MQPLTQFWNIFIAQKETSYLLTVSPYFPPTSPIPHPSPGELLIHILFLYICFFWTFHVGGIIYQVVFCDWLLLFSMICSRHVHAVACINISLLFIVNNISLQICATFCWSNHLMIGIWIVPTQAIMNNITVIICVYVFCANICVYFFFIYTKKEWNCWAKGKLCV